MAEGRISQGGVSQGGVSQGLPAFEEVGVKSGIAFSSDAQPGMGIAVADVDDDGGRRTSSRRTSAGEPNTLHVGRRRAAMATTPRAH